MDSLIQNNIWRRITPAVLDYKPTMQYCKWLNCRHIDVVYAPIILKFMRL